MLPIAYLNLANVPAFRSVQMRDALMARQDRVPQADQVDLPEIQESFRVSFSDETQVGEAMPTRNALATRPNDPTALYRQVASL